MRIAINGFGRIGRNILRAIYESNRSKEFEIVAINDLVDLKTNAHLLRYDSTHGRFASNVTDDERCLGIDDNKIAFFQQRNPRDLPWDDLKIDLVLECTGFFRQREKAELHIQAGAKKVLVSAPGKNLDKTIVYGVNERSLHSEDTMVSNASCTTNCLAHVAKAVHDALEIESGLATTVHAYTNTQNLVDSSHKDLRRARAAAYSMIPTSTGSAKAIGAVLPELDGLLDAVAVRVPTLNVSLLDLTILVKKSCNISQIEAIFSEYEKTREGVFSLSKDELVSIDFNHNPASCVLDFPQTRLQGRLIKLQSWYDNEWGFSNRMLDTAASMHTATQ